MKMPPATLVRLRSALAVSVLFTVVEVTPGVGSGVAEVTVATLLIAPSEAAVATATWSTTILVEPGARGLLRVHDTLLGPVQIQPVPVPETRERPAGSGSVKLMPVASDGPLLPTVIVYCTSVPATNEPVAELAMVRSARALMVPASEKVLLADVGSVLDELATTTLAAAPRGADGATVTGRSKLREAALIMPARCTHDTTAVPVQDQPDGDAPVKVMPAGSVSLTVTGPTASDGPLLVTVIE